MVNDETHDTGIGPFLELARSPGANTAGIPIRRCDECGHPATVAWPLRVPVLKEHTGRELACVFLCDECSSVAGQALEGGLHG